jgi:thioredoxin type arsenate reductase
MTTTTVPGSNKLFHLLGNQIRWRLLELLAKTDRTVLDLVDLLSEKQNLISYHLNALEKSKLVSERRSIADAREIYYSLNVDQLQRLFFTAGGNLHPALDPTNTSEITAYNNLKAPVRVLFLCTHNSARSQMAEGILRQQGGDLVEVYSAGNIPTAIHPLAIRAMEKLNIDIRGQRSKSMDQFLKQKFDFVITVCDRAKESCPIFPGDPNQIHWSFPDPSEATGSEEQRYKVFTRIATELNRRVGYLLMMIQRSLAGN